VEFETRAIHAGQDPDPHTGAVTVPIYATSTYAQRAVGEFRYDYSRTANPTREAFETCLASLEGADHGIAFGSGMAATTTVMHLLEHGAHVVAVNDVYGGTYRLFSKVYEPKGYRFTYVTADECNAGLGGKLEGAAMLWLETPTNPLLNVADIAIVAQILQRPLEHGADIVVHSTTKYLGGHSDLIGGVAATSDAGIAERLRFLQNSLGAVPGPFDAWLALRGLKTLAVRMRAHCANAEQVVAFLQGHSAVERVLYPGLPGHPGHDIAARQMDGFGGMASFLAASEEEALALVARTRIWTLAESLGGVESLIEHPGQMTHASTADSPFAVPATLVRLSVGIESADDLIADLDQSLAGS